MSFGITATERRELNDRQLQLTQNVETGMRGFRKYTEDSSIGVNFHLNSSLLV
jgi:hypothetical protein